MDEGNHYYWIATWTAADAKKRNDEFERSNVQPDSVYASICFVGRPPRAMSEVQRAPLEVTASDAAFATIVWNEGERAEFRLTRRGWKKLEDAQAWTGEPEGTSKRFLLHSSGACIIYIP
jgi:hypothetical protein